MVPKPLRLFTIFNPMFYMINGLRYGMLGFSDVPLAQCVTIVIILFIGLLAATVYLFKIGYN